MRLNKHIADTGYCSRREADRLIAAGRITVNGQRGGIGTEVGEGDEVLLDGRPLPKREEKRGHKIGCDEDGIPLDAGHHWNKG